jgi:hypothetical protein
VIEGMINAFKVTENTDYLDFSEESHLILLKIRCG